MKFYFSGADTNKRLRLLCDCGVKRISVDYNLIRRIPQVFKDIGGEFNEILIFPGIAWQNTRGLGPRKKEAYDVFMEQYFDFVRDNRDIIDIAGVYVDNIEDTDLAGVGRMPIYDERMRRCVFSECVRDYGMASFTGKYSDMIIMRARTLGGKLHISGLAQYIDKSRIIARPEYVSVSEWRMGERYGKAFPFSMGRLHKVLPNSNEIMRYIAQAKKYGIDPRLFLRRVPDVMARFNVLSLLEYEKYLNR